MDYRSLVNKLNAIENGLQDSVIDEAVKPAEAPAATPATPVATPAQSTAPATPTISKGDAVKVILQYVEKGKAPQGDATYINPTSGKIQYNRNEGMSQSSPSTMPEDWIPRYEPQLAKALELLPEVVVKDKGIFGLNNGVTVDLKKLQTVSTQIATDDKTRADLLADLKLLIELVDQYLALKAKKASVKKETYTNFSKSLVESFGYTINETALTPQQQQTLAPYLKKDATGQWYELPATDPKEQGATMGTMITSPEALAQIKSPEGQAEVIQQLLAMSNPANAVKPVTSTSVPVDNVEMEEGIGSVLSKAIPGVGLVLGTQDAWARFNKGDYLGAAIAGMSGITSLIPGAGIAASVGLSAANMARDYVKDKQGAAAPAGTTASTASNDPRLAQLQQLIGATPDGKYGPETKTKLQTWQQQNGLQADGMPGPQTYAKAGIKENMNTSQTVAEQIKSLQDRLAMIETQSQEEQLNEFMLDEAGNLFDSQGNQVTDEGILDLVKAGANIGKNFVSGLKGGGTVQQAGKAGQFGKIATGGRTAQKVGSTIAKNPFKTAIATGAAAGGLAGMAGGAGAAASPTGTTAPASTTTPSISPTAPASTPDTSDSDKEMTELKARIDALVGKLSSSQDPEIQKGIAGIKAKLGDTSTPAATSNVSNATVDTTKGPNMGQVNK